MRARVYFLDAIGGKRPLTHRPVRKDARQIMNDTARGRRWLGKTPPNMPPA